MAEAASTEFLALQEAVAGRYSLERELGRGGMGIVYLARDVALDRLVAIKLLPQALAAEPRLREQFLQEARTAAGLSHPNIVPIHTVEEHGDLVFFVMTFVDGETLRERVERAGPLRLSDAVRLIEEVAWALTLAHARGIVHRDVKPDNIMIHKATGRAMVTDFGIARVAHAATSRGSGELVGTAHYMSPEQAMGEEVDARSDFYSLGVTAFYALTGSLPFDAPTLPAIIGMHVSKPPPSIVSIRPNVPAKLAEAVNRCLAKDPDARFQSAEDLANGIGGLGLASKDVPPLVRYFLRSVGVLGYMLLALAFGWQWGRADDFWSVLPIALAAFAVPVLMAARMLVRSGMAFDDVRTALTTARRLKREEREAVTEDMRRGLWRVRMVLVVAGLVLIVGGVAEMGVAAEVGGILPWFLVPLGAGCLLLGLLPPTPRTRWFWKLAAKLEKPVSRDAPMSRAAPRWLGILAKHLGKLLFRVAGIGLKAGARPPPPAIEHTEVILAAAADSLFDNLPKEHRRRLADLPNVMRRLEGHARTLRERRDELERVLSAARSGPVDVDGTESESTAARVFELETAARATSERLATAVAAQEQIRLDLMRLQGGVGSIEGLTGDLQAAERLSEEIDAVLEGLRQVAAVMRVTPGEGAMATTRRFRS